MTKTIVQDDVTKNVSSKVTIFGLFGAIRLVVRLIYIGDCDLILMQLIA